MALFAGVGGLELGLHIACPGYRTVCHIERDAYGASVLVARVEDQALGEAPVWDDVVTFDGRPWRGVVDLISGGFPCQDISQAGKRAGIGGKRSGLWAEFARVIGDVRPRLVFVENVAALAIRGLNVVLGDLASLGFDAEWATLGAADVGAPHRRERLFVLAQRVPNADRQRRGREWCSVRRERDASPGHDTDRCGSAKLADSPEPRRERGAGSNDAECELAQDGGRVPLPLWPPGPLDLHAWREVQANAQPSVCRGADGAAEWLVDRADRLRCIGNGVVPLQAAVAFRLLADRLGVQIDDDDMAKRELASGGIR